MVKGYMTSPNILLLTTQNDMQILHWTHNANRKIIFKENETARWMCLFIVMLLQMQTIGKSKQFYKSFGKHAMSIKHLLF